MSGRKKLLSRAEARSQFRTDSKPRLKAGVYGSHAGYADGVRCPTPDGLQPHHIGEELVEQAFERWAVSVLEEMHRLRELRMPRQTMRDAAECEDDGCVRRPHYFVIESARRIEDQRGAHVQSSSNRAAIGHASASSSAVSNTATAYGVADSIVVHERVAVSFV